MSSQDEISFVEIEIDFPERIKSSYRMFWVFEGQNTRPCEIRFHFVPFRGGPIHEDDDPFVNEIRSNYDSLINSLNCEIKSLFAKSNVQEDWNNGRGDDIKRIIINLATLADILNLKPSQARYGFSALSKMGVENVSL